MYRDDILYYYDYYIILGHVECNINTFLHMYMEGSYYEGIMPVVRVGGMWEPLWCRSDGPHNATQYHGMCSE